MKVVYLSGGVGGARLLQGMAQVLPPGDLTTIVNTGDDFVHWGLNISPDLDTVMYTLSGLGDMQRGWGLAEESFAARDMMARYEAPGWFALGDRDLATHLVRSEALREGERLTAITARLCAALGVQPSVLPMCDAPRATVIDTERDGTLGFQDWLVKMRGQPAVRAVRFEGERRATAEVLAALEACQLVVIGPSNPYVSVDPILTLEGVRERVAAVPVVALSPIVGGKAVKGPLAEMIPRLARRPADPNAIVAHYDGLVRGMVVESGDEASVSSVPVLGTQTVMGDLADRTRLARELLTFAEGLS